MNVPTLEDLLKAGVHFGHKGAKWHPKASRYIYTMRSGIHIIDLEKTQKYLVEALEFVKKLGSAKKTLLFVGSKAQARDAIVKHATAVGQPFMTERWIGGTLTNFEIVSQKFHRLAFLKKQELDPTFATKYTKRERQLFGEERAELERIIGGMAQMTKSPSALFVVDMKQEKTALAEARVKGIPVIAIADTDVNPETVEYPIPANDDGSKALELLIGLVASAYAEGAEQASPEADASVNAPEAAGVDRAEDVEGGADEHGE